jgi:hypothetical protein
MTETKPGFVEIDEQETNANVLPPRQRSMGEGEGFDLEYEGERVQRRKLEVSGEFP